MLYRPVETVASKYYKYDCTIQKNSLALECNFLCFSSLLIWPNCPASATHKAFEEVDDGGCAGVSRGRLTRGDMANADRSSRPSLPCPPEVWPSQPARRSEPTRTRPTDRILLPHFPVYRSPPTSTHPSVRLYRTTSLCGTSRVCVPECPPLGRPSF